MRLITSILFFSMVSGVALAQQEPAKRPFVTETAAFIEMSFNRPIAVGDNYLNAATNLESGIGFKFGFFFYDQFYAGARYHAFTLNVTNPEIYGNALRASFNSPGFLVGYSYELSERASLKGDGGFGWIRFRNELPPSFDADLIGLDRGTYVDGNLTLDYKVTKDFGFFTGVAYQYNFMEIATTTALQPLFNNSAYVTLQFGIRFYVR